MWGDKPEKTWTCDAVVDGIYWEAHFRPTMTEVELLSCAQTNHTFSSCCLVCIGLAVIFYMSILNAWDALP